MTKMTSLIDLIVYIFRIYWHLLWNWIFGLIMEKYIFIRLNFGIIFIVFYIIVWFAVFLCCVKWYNLLVYSEFTGYILFYDRVALWNFLFWLEIIRGIRKTLLLFDLTGSIFQYSCFCFVVVGSVAGHAVSFFCYFELESLEIYYLFGEGFQPFL